MRALVFLVAIGVVVGDVSHIGYHYNVPKTSFGFPSYQASAHAAGANGASSYNSQSSSQGYQGLSAGLANGYQNAGYQGQHNSGYQGVASGQQNAGYQGQQSGAYQVQHGAGYHLGQQSVENQGQQLAGYQGQHSVGYQGQQGQQNYQQSGHQVAGYPGQKNDVYQGLSASQQSSGYQTPSYHNQAGQSSKVFQSSFGSSSGSAGITQPVVLASADASQGGLHYQSKYQTSAEQKYQQHYQYQQQPAQVFKHYYVHAAPEEPEVAQFRKPIVLPPPQKHYKIIFIKTPTAPTYTAPVLPVQQQNEEKTIVYVLVNNPDAPQDVEVPKVEQKPPTKPEVYFIKYNSKENSQAVINNIVNDLNKGEGQASFSGSDVNVVDGSKAFSAQQSVSSNDEVINHVAEGQASVGFGSGVQSQSLSEVSDGQAVSSVVVDSGNKQEYSNHITADDVNSAFSQGSESGSSGLVHGTVSSGLTHGTVTGPSSNYDNSNSISTSQGVPHETYGIPSFRVA